VSTEKVAGLGGRVRAARRDKHLTLAALAERAGVSKGYLSTIENGKSEPTASIIARLSEALGVSCDWLILGPPPPPPVSAK